MEVYALVYKAEFDCEVFDDVYLYDSFEKAHEKFVDIIKDWFNDELFNVEMPKYSIVWSTDEYDGYYHKYREEENLYIEERHNVVNYLSVRVEKLEIH